MQKKILIYDTTLRDGEQAPGFAMDIADKVMMARQLIKLGVDIIEAGFPAASTADFTAVQQIAEIAGDTGISVLCRSLEQDILRGWDAVKNSRFPILHVFIPASDIQIKHQMQTTREKILKQAITSINYAKSFGCFVQFSAMDATRADRTFLNELMSEVITAGAGAINISDTTGYILPEEVTNLTTDLKRNVIKNQDVILSIHCHNDLGLATANTLTAITAGIDQVEVTVNGIGERAGNASLEEVIAILEKRKDILDIKTNIKKEQIFATSQLLSRITNINVQPHKPIVGKNSNFDFDTKF